MNKTSLSMALAIMTLVSTEALASACTWEEIDTHKVIEVETADADGGERRTKVWIVLIDGVPYLRTSDSRWLANLRRDPALTLHAGECRLDAVAEEVDEEGLVDAIDAASAIKYGWQQRLTRFFRYRTPEVLRLALADKNLAPTRAQ